MTPKTWFRVDAILKEELMRSIVVWFVSFLAIAGLATTGYIRVPGFWPFILALVPAAVHAALMTRYRRREGIADPSIPAIVCHLTGSRSTDDEKQPGSSRIAAQKMFDILPGPPFSLSSISS